MSRHVITCKKKGKRKELKECPECEKEFNFQSELKRHIEVVHLKVRKYKCDQCGKGFAQKCMLDDHINAVHLKKKEHQCQSCGYSFARLSQLTRHVSAVHLLEKRHECPECGKSFARKDRLRSHVMAVHVTNLMKNDDNDDDNDGESCTPENISMDSSSIDGPIQSITAKSHLGTTSAEVHQLDQPESIIGVVDNLNNFNILASTYHQGTIQQVHDAHTCTCH